MTPDERMENVRCEGCKARDICRTRHGVKLLGFIKLFIYSVKRGGGGKGVPGDLSSVINVFSCAARY